MSYQPPSPQKLADQGSRIYERKYRSEFEQKWKGRYAAIDIDTEQAFVEDFPEDAISTARKELPGKLFYLIRIGSRGAFRIGRRTAVNASSR